MASGSVRPRCLSGTESIPHRTRRSRSSGFATSLKVVFVIVGSMVGLWCPLLWSLRSQPATTSYTPASSAPKQGRGHWSQPWWQETQAESFQVGDAVRALSAQDSRFHAGYVESLLDEQILVRWTYPGGGPDCEIVPILNVKRKVVNLEVGMRFAAQVVRVHPGGVFMEIGAPDPIFVPRHKMARRENSMAVGKKATIWIERIGRDGSVSGSMLYRDKDELPLETKRKFRDLAFSRSPAPGVVVWTAESFAGINVTLPDSSTAICELHRSQVRDGKVADMSKELFTGQEVEVYVLPASRTPEGFRVSLKEPKDLTEFKELQVAGSWLSGTVVKVLQLPPQVLVDVRHPRVGMVATGIMPLSALKKRNNPGPVLDPADSVSVGEEVLVRIVKLDTRTSYMQLSMRDG